MPLAVSRRSAPRRPVRGTSVGYGALGGLLATTAMGGWPAADEFSIAVALDSWHPTRGILLVGKRRAGRRVVFSDHQLRVVAGDVPQPKGTWTFSGPFGTQEVVGEFSTTDVITVAQHLDTSRINTFLNVTPLKDLSDPETLEGDPAHVQDLSEPFPPDPDPAGGAGGQMIREFADAPAHERTPQPDRTRGGRLDDEGNVIVTDQAGTTSRPRSDS